MNKRANSLEEKKLRKVTNEYNFEIIFLPVHRQRRR